MKRFNGSSVLFLWILSLTTVFFIFQPYANGEEVKPPGPDFHDGSWEQRVSQENWISERLTLLGYVKSDLSGTQLGMEVYYDSEIVMVAWGTMFKNHQLDVKNALYAIKQEDGNWKIGNAGQEWWEIIEEQDKVWFFVETESGLKEGRSFPKDDFGELPETGEKMDID
ncbi:MAG: hypothetical protein HYW34_04095 [Candidatus Brennerbacteria bacterium]|nr:hypothetical protein [Candidatus Brennerbacteria bacterium]